MNDENELAMLECLRHCTIANEYDGLRAFESFAIREPAAALRIAWAILTSREDPGRDDQMLCIELLRIANETAGRDRVEKLILANWSGISDEIRRNVTAGAAKRTSMSLELARVLFGLDATRVEQRHHIAAALIGGDWSGECERFIVDLVSKIGTYAEPYRQEILNSFAENVVRNYGTKK